jgi:16S rRNA (guanine(966)-N(2))-methyltransferase RsmD
MRVISGSAKGIRLTSVPGKSTRPITDQVKEALFNILGQEIIEKTFLDLFGGTGAVGIEALSRGADHAVFLEINYQAYSIIKKNLVATELDPYATVMKMDAFKYLNEPHEESFDFIYIAPPQYEGLWLKAMEALDRNPELLEPSGTVVVQIHPKEMVEDIGYANFIEFNRRIYGDTMLVFFSKSLPEGNP